MTERTLGDVATKLLFENDRVKVWELALGPGESSDVHEHEHDYLLIQLEGDKIAGIFEEDTHGEFPPGIVEGDVAPGNVFYTPQTEHLAPPFFRFAFCKTQATLDAAAERLEFIKRST